MQSIMESICKINEESAIFKTIGHKLLRHRAKKSGASPREHVIKKVTKEWKDIFHHKNKRKLRINNEEGRKISVPKVKKKAKKKEVTTKHKLRIKSPASHSSPRSSSFKCCFTGFNKNSINNIFQLCKVLPQLAPKKSERHEVLIN